ncbi:MAG: hypothetical protein KBT07_09170 [Clostridiales bacterium]|nr:hypothetical protein [Candidatus Scatonaster coprocaballi]
MQPVIQQSNDGISNQQLIRMSISSSEYVNEMPSIAENIVDYLAEENSMNVSIDDVVGENFRTDFSRLIGFVKDIKWNRKKYVKKKGCYGIMIAYDANKTKKYFSYSGKTDYMGGVNNSKLTCDPNFVALATETRNYLGKEYTWAQLSDETRRYLSVYSTKDNQVCNESSLKDDASTNYTEDELGSAYGCCERKMQAANYNNFNSAKEFYARWAPCYKCIPALILEKGGIRIFALALDHEAWLANPDDSTIKEYKLGAGFIEA